VLELVRTDKEWFVVGGVPNAEIIKRMNESKKP
jgi:hypothetical protein